MKTVLLTEPVDEAGMQLLQKRADIQTIVAKGLDPQRFKQVMSQVHAIGVRTAKLDAATLSLAPHLELVSKHGIGCDNIAVDHLSSRGIPVAIAADASANTVAEHAIMLMLASVKHLLQYDGAVRNGNWAMRTSPIAGELGNRTVLIVGFGRIGQRVATLCTAFGMHVTIFDPAISKTFVESKGYQFSADLDDALRDADFVALHIPFSPATQNLFNEKRISRFKPGAILINCARGGIVDENALYHALASGRIAAAGIDVLKQEPPAPNHPLFSLKNVILTPHSAALTHEGSRNMAFSMARNIIDFFDGKLTQSFIINANDISSSKSANLRS